jgi:predicted permease
LIQIQLEILLLIAAGYLITKKGVFTSKSRGELTNLVIYIILPCNIFASFHKGMTRETLIACATILVISVALQAMYILLNKFLYRKISPERQTVLKYATICNNSGFMGIPIMGAVFGDLGQVYGAVNLIPIRVSMWTAGMSMFTATDFKTKFKTLATHPCIWAVILGFVYALVPFELPGFVLGAIDVVGDCVTALTMFIVGSILAGVRVREALDKHCFYYSAIRLVLIPALVYGALLLIGVDATVRGVAVLSAAMPAATTTAMLAEKYCARDSGSAEFAAKLIFVSTALSLVTLPVLSLFL